MSITSDRILQEIKKKDFSYGQLSKITGINKADLQRYATGKTKKIPTDRLFLIAKALDVVPGYLLGMSNFSTFGSFLKTLRENAGLSYYSLSDRCGVDANKIISFETNLALPTVDELLSIAKVIDPDGDILEFLYNPELCNGIFDEEFYHKYFLKLGIEAQTEAREEMILLNAWYDASEKDKKTVAFILGFDYEPKEDDPAHESNQKGTRGDGGCT